jgi:pimeloyl-ACP methyl ester carboxylesterase
VNLTHFAPKREWVLTVLLTGLAALVPGGTHARDDDPVALVRGYLSATDAASRAAAVTRIVTHPEYRPSRLSGWLHRAWPYAASPAGPSSIDVPYGPGTTRRVHIIYPEGYRPDRAWPLVYALHPSGASGLEWADYVRAMLGRRARDYVIAAPDGFKQNYIDSAPPFTPEHPAILDAVLRAAHVDPNRVYAFGYSKGGFGAWFVALYYPDRLAGAVSFSAGFDMTVDDGGFWRFVIQNVAHIPVYNAWGGRDTLVAHDLNEKPDGTFAEQNRRFAQAVFGLGLPITNVEVPGGLHNSLAPPVEPLLTVLASRRAINPKRISHTFRHLHQASAYWLEGLTWVGDRWGDPRPALLPAREGETERHVLARTLEPLLGRLTGTIDGQTIRITRQHIGDVVVWFAPETINWDKPVRIEVDGSVVFDGPIVRDPAVALARASATMDFDWLRWAGIRIDAAGKPTPVSADAMPEPVWKRDLTP